MASLSDYQSFIRCAATKSVRDAASEKADLLRAKPALSKEELAVLWQLDDFIVFWDSLKEELIDHG